MSMRKRGSVPPTYYIFTLRSMKNCDILSRMQKMKLSTGMVPTAAGRLIFGAVLF